MRSDIYTGTFVFLLSSFMYYIACALPAGMFGTLGAGFFPKMIFGLLSILSFALIVKTLYLSFIKKQITASAEPFHLSKYTIVIVAFIIFFLFVMALKYLGFVIASMLFMPTLMWILGPKTKASLVPIIATSVGMTAGIYLSFTHLLQVFLPSGILF